VSTTPKKDKTGGPLPSAHSSKPEPPLLLKLVQLRGDRGLRLGVLLILLTLGGGREKEREEEREREME
jgi:hypothetical protein